MEILQQLGLVLGLGTLAGINLYLTVAITGLALRFDLITLGAAHQDFALLENDLIITAAIVLFCIEFFADKIPWVDSAWDLIHTIARPAGAVVLALGAIGQVDPSLEILVGLLAGTAALTSHTLKASTRVAVNSSPEPFSNVGLSVAEDAIVIAGLALVFNHPAIAAIVFALILVGLWILLPHLLRQLRTFLYFASRRLRPQPAPADGPPPPADLPIKVRRLLSARVGQDSQSCSFANRCITARSSGDWKLPANRFGTLVLLADRPSELFFVLTGTLSSSVHRLDLSPGGEAFQERRLLSEDLVLRGPAGSRANARFRFTLTSAPQLAALVRHLDPNCPDSLAPSPLPATAG